MSFLRRWLVWAHRPAEHELGGKKPNDRDYAKDNITHDEARPMWPSSA
jgi:hypothetical protein